MPNNQLPKIIDSIKRLSAADLGIACIEQIEIHNCSSEVLWSVDVTLIQKPGDKNQSNRPDALEASTSPAETIVNASQPAECLFAYIKECIKMEDDAHVLLGEISGFVRSSGLRDSEKYYLHRQIAKKLGMPTFVVDG